MRRHSTFSLFDMTEKGFIIILNRNNINFLHDSSAPLPNRGSTPPMRSSSLPHLQMPLPLPREPSFFSESDGSEAESEQSAAGYEGDDGDPPPSPGRHACAAAATSSSSSSSSTAQFAVHVEGLRLRIFNVADATSLNKMPERCPHIAACLAATPLVLDDAACKQLVCVACKSAGENWLCLTCHKAFCGRFVRGHMFHHGLRHGHPISLSLGDKSVVRLI